MSDRINELAYECRVYSVKELRYTQNQKAVCNARVNTATKIDDEWRQAWFSLIAWGDAAEVLATCQHGDDIIIRDGRIGADGYKTREGEVRVEPAMIANQIEKVGSMAPPPSRHPQGDDDVPF